MSNFKNEKQGISLKCPSCGSALKFNPDTQSFYCSVCSSEFSEESLEEKATSFVEQKNSDETLKEYHCPSCGAEILADEHTTTDFCIYCGNPVVLRGRLSGELKPNLIIPFSIDKKQAQEILIEYLNKYSYVPKSFYSESNLEKIAGIYYPFWESDIDTNSTLEADAKNVRTYVVGDKQYTETKYYKIKRSGKVHFEDISVNALKNADKKLIESILPYPIKNHIPFNMAYLSGFYAKKNDLSYEDIKGDVKDKLSDYSRTLLEDTIHGYTSVNTNISRAKILKESHDYTLLPVWILNYKYKNKDYTFAVNGVTGKAFGEIPISKAKLGLTLAGISAGVFAVVSLILGAIL